MDESECTGHASTEIETFLIQMSTSNSLRELKNKGIDQFIIPKSDRGRLRMPGAVAY